MNLTISLKKILQLGIYSFVSVSFLIFYQCKKKTDRTASHPRIMASSCIPTGNLLGKQFLDTTYLVAIDSIKTSPIKAKDRREMLLIKGGDFDMGGDFPKDRENMPKMGLPQKDEFPKHRVRISSFYMDEHEVTIGQFREFVKATNYKTVAERNINWKELKKQLPPGTPKPKESLLKSGAVVFHYPSKNINKNNLAHWWSFVHGANWKNPQGKTFDIEKHLNYPVTQISWYDAMAYAKWVGKRLPTEAEFEYAMRGGKEDTLYPWGNEKVNTGRWKGNFLQGNFPYSNSSKDGFEFLAPVESFPPNPYGLYDIAGNVWEWTLDWYSPYYYKELKDNQKVAINPKGPKKSIEIYNSYSINKVVRGGSFLCSDDWCSGYRNARRMRLSPDSAMQHIGFRLVRDISKK